MFSVPTTVVFVSALHISLVNKDECTLANRGTDTWMGMCPYFLELTYTHTCPSRDASAYKAWITKVTKILRLYLLLLLFRVPQNSGPQSFKYLALFWFIKVGIQSSNREQQVFCSMSIYSNAHIQSTMMCVWVSTHLHKHMQVFLCG